MTSECSDTSPSMTVTEKEILEFDALIFEVAKGLTSQQATRFGLLMADRIIATCQDICTGKICVKCHLMKQGIDLAWSEVLAGKQLSQKVQVLCGQAVPSSDEAWEGLISALIFTSANAVADFVDASLDDQEYAPYLSRCVMDLFDVIRDEGVVDDERLSALWSDEMFQQLSILGQIEQGVEVARDPDPKSFFGEIVEILANR